MTWSPAAAMGQLEAVHNRNRRAGELLGAVFGDEMVAWDLGGRFSCAEADNIANALSLLGQSAAAETWARGHAAADEPDDTHYQPPTRKGETSDNDQSEHTG
jgi:hypothetical protein